MNVQSDALGVPCLRVSNNHMLQWIQLFGSLHKWRLRVRAGDVTLVSTARCFLSRNNFISRPNVLISASSATAGGIFVELSRSVHSHASVSCAGFAAGVLQGSGPVACLGTNSASDIMGVLNLPPADLPVATSAAADSGALESNGQTGGACTK